MSAHAIDTSLAWKARYTDEFHVSHLNWHFDLPVLDGARKEFVKELRALSTASFAATGSFKEMPVVDVPGFGRLPLPLDDATMEQLAVFCEQAPFGKGSETVVDTDVRNVLQTDAANITFANPGFQEEMERVFRQVGVI